MSDAIVTTTKVREIQIQFNRVADAIRSAKTLDDIGQIRDAAAATRAYLESSSAAKQMGDKLDDIRADLRALWLLADLRLGDLAKATPPAEKPAIAVKLGVTPRHVSTCERAATVEPEIRETIIRGGSRDKPADLRLLVKAATLPAPVRAAAVAKISDDVDARQAIEAAASRHWAAEAAKRAAAKPVTRSLSPEAQAAKQAATDVLAALNNVGDAHRRATVAARRYLAVASCLESPASAIKSCGTALATHCEDLRQAVAGLVRAEGGVP